MTAPAVNPLDLKERTILVTGASSGIGADTAVLLSQLNGKIVLTGRDTGRLEATHARLSGSGHTVAPFDLVNVGGIGAWLKDVTARCGPLDGVVHCAGIRFSVPLRLLSVERTDEILRSNVAASLMLAKAFRQRGCYSPGSSLVFLSSVAGLTGDAGIAAYAASKAALIGLAKSLSIELAADKIRVNCVAAGVVKAGMIDRFAQSITAEQLAAIEAQYPLGLGTTWDVAYASAYLLADTGRWVTGSTLVVDGGFTAH
jgi:NAD(P)-dependent dehydrogenase (short-subunit alcohol dehydrogenase family)